jgi:polyisoprenyl-phosphate glycosyltransferase
VHDSLSIIVPVRNAEATLTQQVEHLLEVLPDLTSRFEIVVVDDGSEDHTVELARDLACEYPQLRLIRHNQQRGMPTAIKTGLQWAQGQTVLVQENPETPSPTDLRRLWSLRHDRPASTTPIPAAPGVFDRGLLERLTTWGQSLRNLARGHRGSGIRMVRKLDHDSLAPFVPVAGERTCRLDTTPTQHAATFLDHLRNLTLGE